MRLDRIRTIASFELRATITRPGFIATTFLLPVVLLGLSGGSIAIQGYLLAHRMASHVTWGFVDDAGMLEPRIEREGVTLLRIPGRDEALRALRSREIEGFAHIDARWLETGRVEVYAPSQRSPFESVAPPHLLVEALVSRLLEGEVDAAVRARVLAPLAQETFIVTREGVERERPDRLLEETLSNVTPIVLGVLFLSALLTASGYLVQAVASDKESRVAEVLLSSVTPDELLFGKLVGLGSAGLVQLFVWVGISSGSAALLGTRLPLGSSFELPIVALLAAPLLFVLGYFFLGSLMLVTGALGSNAAEAQKLAVAWSLLGVAPMFVLISFLDTPHGAIPRALSLVPTSAPLALMLRLAIDPSGVSPVEVGVALALVLLSTYFTLRVGGRLFAYGLLSNALPSPRELLRALRSR